MWDPKKIDAASRKSILSILYPGLTWRGTFLGVWLTRELASSCSMFPKLLVQFPRNKASTVAWILTPSQEVQGLLGGSAWSWWCCQKVVLPSADLEGALNPRLTLGWNVCHRSRGFTGQKQKVATAHSFMATIVSKLFALLKCFGADISDFLFFWLTKLGFRGSLGPASSSGKAGGRGP